MHGDRIDSEPLVSVIIPTYNRPTYLREAVASVREQDYEPIELIVVDDCSETPADETLTEVDTESLADVTCLRHPTNRGVNAARNTGIDAASGEYLAFLDDDDRWHEQKLRRQVEAFEQAGEDVGVVYTGLEGVRNDETVLEIPPEVEELTKALLCHNVVGTMSVVMVRTELADEVRLDERFPSWADLEWYVRLSTTTDFERIPEPLVTYEFTSHGRLSDDVEKIAEGRDRFVEAFDDLAASYGSLFRRRFRGRGAYRVGSAALYAGRYGLARRELAAAIAWYPFEPAFYKHLAAALGGRLTHDVARAYRRLTSGGSTSHPAARR